MFCFRAAHWPSKPSASQSRAPLQAAVCESEATPCTKVDLVHGVTTTRFVNFDWNGGILPKKRKNSAKNQNGWQL